MMHDIKCGFQFLPEIRLTDVHWLMICQIDADWQQISATAAHWLTQATTGLGWRGALRTVWHPFLQSQAPVNKGKKLTIKIYTFSEKAQKAQRPLSTNHYNFVRRSHF